MTLTSFTCLHLHISLSPSIPTSSYLPIFYLTGFEEEREGMGERSGGLAPVVQDLLSTAQRDYLYETLTCHYADISR